MKASITKPGKQYIDLVMKFPLLKIKNETHLDRALEVISELCAWDRKGKLTNDGKDYLSALVELVHAYEQVHYPSEKVPGVEILKFLMEENGLKQSDLAHLFSSKSNLSEILSGKRQISKEQAKRLADHFKLTVAAFID